MKYGKIIYIIISLICVVVFCYIATTGKIFTIDELPLKFMSAFLGVIVTAFISIILQNYKAKMKEIKIKDSFTRKNKRKIYMKFIKRLNQISEEKKINAYTYRKIENEFDRKLKPYLKEKQRQKITCYLERLAECTGVEMNDAYVTATVLNDNIKKIKECISPIIDILNDALGLGVKIDINKQDDLEKDKFLGLLYQTLLEEVDNFFMKKDSAVFRKAFYAGCKDGLFISIPIEGKESSGGCNRARNLAKNIF